MKGHLKALARLPKPLGSQGAAGMPPNPFKSHVVQKRIPDSADISQGTRELVDLSAEAIGSLGMHLAQIGDIIANSTAAPEKGEKGTALRVQEKLERYKAYTNEVAMRKKDIEDKMAEDFARLKAWRKEAGTEGQSLVKELEALYDKIRQQDKELAAERERVEEEQEKVRGHIELGQLKDRKWAAISTAYTDLHESFRAERLLRQGHCGWIGNTFDEVRFKFKSEQEKEKLRIEHHQRMRKARAQDRIDVIRRTRTHQFLKMCVLAFQEEAIESRNERHLKEIRTRFEDSKLIMEAQLAQALGDEEKAKELANENARRMEQARAEAKESERLKKLAEKSAREAKQWAEREAQNAKEAREAEAAALARADRAERAEVAALKAKDTAIEHMKKSDKARELAERDLRDAEDAGRKLKKKILLLQQKLQELGEESDSDAPPDERPPAFFVNEDGRKVPRPRSRKERMGMAYREAESSRWELRIGMAAMLTKDDERMREISRLQTSLNHTCREVQQVRSANVSLAKQIEEAARALKAKASTTLSLASTAAASGTDAGISMLEETLESSEDFFSAREAELPLAASSAAVPSFSPKRPAFVPAQFFQDSEPRLLVKTASQPMFVPPLHGIASLSARESLSPRGSPEKLTSLTLAPLRKVKRSPSEWHVSWH